MSSPLLLHSALDHHSGWETLLGYAPEARNFTVYSHLAEEQHSQLWNSCLHGSTFVSLEPWGDAHTSTATKTRLLSIECVTICASYLLEKSLHYLLHGTDTALLHTSMGACRRLKNLLYILWKGESMNLLLIPLTHRLSQVFLTPYEIATIVRPDLLWLTSPSNKLHQHIKDRVCI